MNLENRSEKGQVLVILVLVFVVLLGFAALAIDGGLIFVDRRGAQNAADAAALAGGWKLANALEDADLGYYINYENWDCSDPDMNAARALAEERAIELAGFNGYTIDNDITDQNGVTTQCMEEDFTTYIDKYVDVEAWVTSEINTAFAHFVFGGGPFVNTVNAVARSRPRAPLGFNYAVVSTSASNGSGGTVTFVGGGIVINSAGRGIVSNNISAAGATVTINGTESPRNVYFNNCSACGGISPSPTSQTNMLPNFSVSIPPLDCNDPDITDRGSFNSSGDATLNPGRYSQITVNDGDEVVLSAGLYCMTGDFQVLGKGTLTGGEVTIYLSAGDFTVGAFSRIDLNAPNGVSGLADGLDGMLIYMAPDNNGMIIVDGCKVGVVGTACEAGEESNFEGTIFGAHPDSTIIVGQSGDMDKIDAQLVGGNITVYGPMTINFGLSQSYQRPATMTLEN